MTEMTQPQGFLAEPAGGQGPGVLVLHAWWGLNQTIRDYCGRLAGEGYTVFAPDLYHGQVADTIAGAQALGSALDAEYRRANAEVAAAAEYLAERAGSERLAVIGFSLGAYYALELAAADPERIRAVVIYYGSGPADFGRSRAVYLGHFAGDDPYEPREGVDALEAAIRSAGRPVTFHHYPDTGHWFAEPDRADAYDASAAELAWERTLAFLRDTLS